MPDKSVTLNGKKVTVGDMRTRVTFQVSSRTSDGQGGFVESWANLDADPGYVWGYLAATSSRERLFAEQMQYQRTHVLLIRFRPDITNEMRLTYDNRTFQVKGTRNPEERNYFLQVDLEENQGK